MIYFKVSSKELLNELKSLHLNPIEFFDDNTGYFMDAEFMSLRTFALNLSQESQDWFVGLMCFNKNELSKAALDYLVNNKISGVEKLSAVLLDAILNHREPLLECMRKWFIQLNPSLVEFGRIVVLADGQLKKSAEYLFLHRNSIRTRFENFHDETGMDLRVVECLKVFELCDVVSKREG